MTATIDVILTAVFVFELADAAFIDTVTMTIPDTLNIVIAGTGLVYSFLSPPFYWHVIGALAAGLPMLIISMCSEMGGGDVKFAAASGFFIGGTTPLLALAAAFIMGGLAALFMMFSDFADSKTPISFAPFLCAGFVITFL